MITEENTRLSTKPEVQKSNFERSQLLNFLTPPVATSSVSQADGVNKTAGPGVQGPTVRGAKRGGAREQCSQKEMDRFDLDRRIWDNSTARDFREQGYLSNFYRWTK